MKSEVISGLRALSEPGFFEIYEKSTFKCYRHKKNGEVQTVTIDILDSGTHDGNRYQCIATGNDGTTASGNPAGTIDEVLKIVHWGDLDKAGSPQ